MFAYPGKTSEAISMRQDGIILIVVLGMLLIPIILIGWLIIESLFDEHKGLSSKTDSKKKENPNK